MIDGVDLNTGAIGIRCTGAKASLALHRSTVSGFTASAMIIASGKLEMDRSTVIGNGSATAITPILTISSVSGYSITNSFIVKNTIDSDAQGAISWPN